MSTGVNPIPEHDHPSFLTTHWTMLGGLGTDDPATRERCLAALTERYWPAVYAFLRRSGLGADAAAEMAQAFFTEVVLGRRLFERACRERGRLRSLLLGALRNFRVDTQRRAAVRAIGRPLIEIEERRLAAAESRDAVTSFEERWALALLEETLRRCREHFVAAGRHAHWELFEARVLCPAMTGNTAPPLESIAATRSFASTGAASAALQVVKRRFECLLREVVAETIGSEEDVEDEVRRVQSALGEG